MDTKLSLAEKLIVGLLGVIAAGSGTGAVVATLRPGGTQAAQTSPDGVTLGEVARTLGNMQRQLEDISASQKAANNEISLLRAQVSGVIATQVAHAEQIRQLMEKRP